MPFAVIFCLCGGNKSEDINYAEIKEILKSKEEILWLENIDLACSSRNKSNLVNQIKTHQPQGLIILSCSPNHKGYHFINLAKEAGINPYMVNFVNIREQAQWVTTDKKALLKKIKALFNGALERLKLQRPVEQQFFPLISDVMVVGGGISGIQSTLTLSRFNRKVYLIEKSLKLGGKTVGYEKIFPHLQCAPCQIYPMTDEILNNDLIDLYLKSEILDIRGSSGNYFVKILHKKCLINPKKCLGCFACEEICPEKAINIDKKYQPLIAEIDFSRCLRAKGAECNECVKVCPVDNTIDFSASDTISQINVGAIMWATGFELFDCSKINSLGYKRYDDIYNSLEFEDLLNSEGPTKGIISTKSGDSPKTIAIIHCVGSLDEDYMPYCSKICCQYAFKFNRLIRDKLPNVEIIHFVKEIVLPGKEAHKLYVQSLKDKLTKIFRYDSLKDINIKKTEGFLIICKQIVTSCDILILLPPMICEIDKNLEDKGIIFTGSVKEPMSVTESINDALSMSALLISSTKKGEYIIKDTPIAIILSDRCSKCGTCINQCPYRAIELHNNKIEIIGSLCEGCGACIASCPSRAIIFEGFQYEQVMAEIKGILSS